MFKKKKKDIAILDFGRQAIKGIVFSKGKKNIIRKFERAKIERFGVFDGKDFELDVIRKSADKVFKGLEDIQDKAISFSPDILKAKVFNISFKRDNPDVEITENEQQTIQGAVFKECVIEGMDILKRKIVQTKVSGYSVESMLGLKGEKIDFRILALFFRQEYHGFEQSLKAVFKLEKARTLHFVEGLAKYADSGVFVNVGVRNTCIVVFKNGLSSIDEFRIGGADFSKKIVDVLGMKQDDADSFLQRFADNELSDESKDKVKEITAPVMNKWLDKFRESMEKSTGSYELPQNMHIFGTRSEFMLIKKSLEELEKKDIGILLLKDLPIKTKVSLSNTDVPSLLLTLAYE